MFCGVQWMFRMPSETFTQIISSPVQFVTFLENTFGLFLLVYSLLLLLGASHGESIIMRILEYDPL